MRPIPGINFYLSLTSETVDPGTINKELGIEPTASCKIGSKRPSARGSCDFHSWVLSTGYQESLDVDVQVKQIYEKLLPVKENLKKLTGNPDVHATFQFVIRIYGDQTPAIHLEKHIIDFASECNIEFDFDTYVCEPEEGSS
jgi:hypothetical protein